jgi:hypothetical protein
MYASDTITARYVIYSLYLASDAILATKTAMVTFAGLYFMTMVKMFYKEPRPYWKDDNIKAFECMNDYNGPSDNMFVMTFVYSYINLLYLRKYARKQNKILSNSLLIL